MIEKVIERTKEGFRWLYYYVTPEDTARAFRLAMEVENVPYDVLFVAAADNCVDESTFDMLRRNRILPFPEVRLPLLYKRNPRASVLDPERAKRVIGFEPSSDWMKVKTQKA
ncbi:MAG: hypothetical protein NTY59_14655 [Alphaproteobacteria bacterium]|nr:hypothetical protein [Alphaproteobacteria bacterium]